MGPTTSDAGTDPGFTATTTRVRTDNVAPAVAAEPDDMGRALTADHTIKNHVIATISAAIIPVPVVDVAAIIGIQLNMIRKLSELYGKPFSQSLGKSIIFSLGGGILGYGVGATLTISAIKIIPGIGWMIGWATLPVVAGATTFAIGRVFAKHYEEGGSMFDLSTKSVSAYYKQEYQKGRILAEREKVNIKAEDAEEKARRYAHDTVHYGNSKPA